MKFISFNLLIARKIYAGEIGKTHIITAHTQIHKHTPYTQTHTDSQTHKHTHTNTQTHTSHTHTHKQTHTHEHTKTHELQSKKPFLDSWFYHWYHLSSSVPLCKNLYNGHNS